MKSVVDQRKANAGNDMVARDKITTVYNSTPSKIQALLEKLKAESAAEVFTKETISELARYHQRQSTDGIEGLESKLKKAGLGHAYLDAIEQKEAFAKLLSRYTMFASAQEIFVHYLTRVRMAFNKTIYPDLPSLTEAQANMRIHTEIVKSIVDECYTDVFHLDDEAVFGMLYWLAEQCFVKWHHG
ncbi:hypothetical protein N9W89_08545 [Hellea sp.]|nr:hypothetical protein [Hellea sp.]